MNGEKEVNRVGEFAKMSPNRSIAPDGTSRKGLGRKESLFSLCVQRPILSQPDIFQGITLPWLQIRPQERGGHRLGGNIDTRLILCD